MNASDRSGYAPSWYTATMVPAIVRPPLTAEIDVDVCVVGAGLAGLTTAREVARRGWSVAVLESGRIAWNASGRNCGFVLPGFGIGIDRIVERVGFDHARDLWTLSEGGLEYVRNTIRETGMPGVDPVGGWLDVSKTEDAERILATLRLLGQDFGVEIEGWAADRVRQVLKSSSYFNAIHYPRAFHVHPLNYALGLAEAAEQAGADIFEHTPATAIDPDGVRKRIETRQGRIRAAHVVLAGSVHIGTIRCRAWRARCCRSGRISQLLRRSAQGLRTRSPMAAPSATASVPTTTIASSMATACSSPGAPRCGKPIRAGSQRASRPISSKLLSAARPD